MKYFGDGSLNVWLGDVACQGQESHLGHCQHAPWGSAGDCNQAAGCSCEPIAGKLEHYIQVGYRVLPNRVHAYSTPVVENDRLDE